MPARWLPGRAGTGPCHAGPGRPVGHLYFKQPDIQLVWTVAIHAGAAHTFSCAGSAHDDTFMPAFDLLKVNKVSKRLHWSSCNSAHVPRSRQVK